MANILDYVKGNQHTFAEEELNELDSLVFAELTYCHFNKKKNIHNFKALDFSNKALIANLTHNVWKQEKMEKLISLLIKSRRFQDVTWSNVVNKIEAESEFEFNAITFHFKPQAVYLAYRGTTATKVGWKEDFNMSFLDSVPAQFFARQYFRKILQQTQAKIFLGGHSKGGNLAFYVALTATKEEQESIIRVDNFDGPGFHNQKARFDKKIKALLPKLHKFIPQGCLIGSLQDDLLDNRHYCKIVQAQGIPPMQHNLFNWKIAGNHFLWAKRLAYPADFSWKTISKWLESTNDQEKRDFITLMYDAANDEEKLYLRDLFTVTGTREFAGRLWKNALNNPHIWQPLMKQLWHASVDTTGEALAEQKDKIFNLLKTGNYKNKN